MSDMPEENLQIYFDEDDEDFFGLDAENIQNDRQEDPGTKPGSSSTNEKNNSATLFSTTNLFYEGPEANGFYLPTGESYFYPTNFPVREYQKSIVETALFNNTLVVLPTGLGKTFIAAVVMYNFYRWYPEGLILFMAPTRPLVTQQIQACTDIMGIPVSDITEITGKSNKKQRIEDWKQKRVFFLTPHVLVNDITNEFCDPSRVRCIIIDEAHKAVGNYAFCQVLKTLSEYFLKFRIVALSATPGNNLQAYQDIVQNLNIAKIQVRAEDSPDVAKYIHGRKLSHIVVRLDGIWRQFQNKFLELYEDYSRILKDNNVVRGNISNLTSFQLLTIMDQFKSKRDLPPDVKHKCSTTLLVCSTLAHAHSLLYTYGFKALHSHFSGGSDSTAIPIVSKNEKLKSLLKSIDDYLKDNGSPANYVASHPKFSKLREVVANHFSSTEYENGQNDSKVIIYCQYRVGVVEAHCALKELEPLIRPVMFIGQSSGKKGGSGLGQKQQLDILSNFRSGKFNTLIATSVGEEGLDIGEVDLIICLDAQSSITRHIQRIGRTGRKRAGACVFLVTEGKEEAKLQKCLTASSTISKTLDPRMLNTAVNGANPRMIPKHINPKIHFVHIKASEGNKNSKTKVKKNAPSVEEEIDEDASTSTKGPMKRKKGAKKDGEKKEKPTKKAKVEGKNVKQSKSGTLFSYFSKKKYESSDENDEEKKSIFSTPKDKQPKNKQNAPALEDIQEVIENEECFIVEKNDEKLEVPPPQQDVESDWNAVSNGIDCQIFEDRKDSSPKDVVTDNPKEAEMSELLKFFSNWVISYSQNNVLVDENFFKLLSKFQIKPNSFNQFSPPESSDLPHTESSPLMQFNSSPTNVDINFNTSCASPILSCRSNRCNMQGYQSETFDHNAELETASPELKRASSPICNRSTSNRTEKKPLVAISSETNCSTNTSTPKSFQKLPFHDFQDDQRIKFIKQNVNTLNENPEKRSNNISPQNLHVSDLDSTSPLILTCKISKTSHRGTSKKLFPDERNVEVTGAKQDEKDWDNCEFLSDSFDQLFENLEPENNTSLISKPVEAPPVCENAKTLHKLTKTHVNCARESKSSDKFEDLIEPSSAKDDFASLFEQSSPVKMPESEDALLKASKESSLLELDLSPVRKTENETSTLQNILCENSSNSASEQLDCLGKQFKQSFWPSKTGFDDSELKDLDLDFSPIKKSEVFKKPSIDTKPNVKMKDLTLSPIEKTKPIQKPPLFSNFHSDFVQKDSNWSASGIRSDQFKKPYVSKTHHANRSVLDLNSFRVKKPEQMKKPSLSTSFGADSHWFDSEKENFKKSDNGDLFSTQNQNTLNRKPDLRNDSPVERSCTDNETQNPSINKAISCSNVGNLKKISGTGTASTEDLRFLDDQIDFMEDLCGDSFNLDEECNVKTMKTCNDVTKESSSNCISSSKVDEFNAISKSFKVDTFENGPKKSMKLLNSNTSCASTLEKKNMSSVKNMISVGKDDSFSFLDFNKRNKKDCPALVLDNKNSCEDNSLEHHKPSVRNPSSNSAINSLPNHNKKISVHHQHPGKNSTSMESSKTDDFTSNPALLEKNNSSVLNNSKSCGTSSLCISPKRSCYLNENKSSPISSDSDDPDLVFVKERSLKNLSKKNVQVRNHSPELVEEIGRKNRKIEKKKSAFIEWEAEVSGSDISADEIEEEMEGNITSSFIHDGYNTMLHPENTMTAKYLESIRSPAPARGNFKIPVLNNEVLQMDVFSQTFHNDADYQNDSFCTDEEVSEGYDCSEEEIIEYTPKKVSEKLKKKSKRKRLITSSSDEEIVIDPVINGGNHANENFSDIICISSGSSDEDCYLKKKPTRRKGTCSDKFTNFRKKIEEKKLNRKPEVKYFTAKPASESRTENKNLVNRNKNKSNFNRRSTNISDGDSDDFLPKPIAHHSKNAGLKNPPNDDTSFIVRKPAKKIRLNLSSSDEG